MLYVYLRICDFRGRHLHPEYIIKENKVQFSNIDTKRSVVKQRVDNNHSVKWIDIPYEDFFDCDCEGDHNLPNCNIYKRRMCKRLKEGKCKLNMNERNSVVTYNRLKRSCKIDYVIYYWVKKVT
jgi:hypothetical protein